MEQFAISIFFLKIKHLQYCILCGSLIHPSTTLIFLQRKLPQDVSGVSPDISSILIPRVAVSI